jgi:hypothetical protein
MAEEDNIAHGIRLSLSRWAKNKLPSNPVNAEIVQAVVEIRDWFDTDMSNTFFTKEMNRIVRERFMDGTISVRDFNKALNNLTRELLVMYEPAREQVRTRMKLLLKRRKNRLEWHRRYIDGPPQPTGAPLWDDSLDDEIHVLIDEWYRDTYDPPEDDVAQANITWLIHMIKYNPRGGDAVFDEYEGLQEHVVLLVNDVPEINVPSGLVVDGLAREIFDAYTNPPVSEDDEWEHPPLDDPSVIEARKKERLTQQDTERTGYTKKASEAERQEYYHRMFGLDHETMMVFDLIEGVDHTVQDYITEDPDNIVFVIRDREGVPPVLFGSKRSVIAEQMAIYECVMDPALGQRKYLSMNLIGYHGVGVMNYEAVKLAVLRSNYQMIALRKAGKTGKLETHEERHFQDNIVSGMHCADGTQRDYYQVHIPGEMAPR